MLHSFTNVLQSCRLQICTQKDIEEPCLLSSLCFLISETGRKSRKLVGSHTVRRASSFAVEFPLLCLYLSGTVAFHKTKSQATSTVPWASLTRIDAVLRACNPHVMLPSKLCKHESCICCQVRKHLLHAALIASASKSKSLSSDVY